MPPHLESVFEESSKVLSGEVIEKRAYWDVNFHKIYTVHKLKTSDFYKGNTSEFLYFLTEGGSVGVEGMISSKMVRINRNAKGFFQLQEFSEIKLDGFDLNTSLHILTNLSYGFIEYDNFSDSVNLSFQSLTSPCIGISVCNQKA